MQTCSRFSEDLALRVTGDLEAGPELSALEAHLAGCAACERLLQDLQGDQGIFRRAASQPDGDMPSLVVPVLAQAAAEALTSGTFRAPVTTERRDLGLLAFGRVAAAVALVAASGVLGYSVLSHGDGEPVVASAPDKRIHEDERLLNEGPIDSAAPSREAMSAGDVAASGDSQQAPAATDQGLAVADAAAPVGGSATPDAPVETARAFRPVRVHRAPGNAVALEWDGDGREAGSEGAGAYKVLASASPRDFSEARPVLVAGRNLVAGDGFPAQRRGDRSLTYFRVE